MIKFRSALGLAAGGAALAAAFVAPSAALADTVQSPIGTVTAGQYLGVYCDDHGAHVRVTVEAGLAGTIYTASSSGALSGPASFVANASGAGQLDLHNVTVVEPGPNKGVVQVTVSAAGTTVVVPASIYCASGKGD